MVDSTVFFRGVQKKTPEFLKTSGVCWALQRHSQHGYEMCGGGEHDEDVPHFMEAEDTGLEVEDLGDVHNRTQ